MTKTKINQFEKFQCPKCNNDVFISISTLRWKTTCNCKEVIELVTKEYKKGLKNEKS